MTAPTPPNIADLLVVAYRERGVAARIATESDGATTVVGDGFAMRLFDDDGRLAISLEGAIGRDDYYALGIADARADGAICAALLDAGRPHDAEQTHFSYLAVLAGQGPLYANGGAR